MAIDTTPATMQQHAAREFHFAHKVLHKLVLGSDFFPEDIVKAADEDDEVGDGTDWGWLEDSSNAEASSTKNNAGGKNKIDTKIQGDKRTNKRRSSCWLSLADSSVGTASTTSLTSSIGGSPLVARRATIDVSVMTPTAASLGLPLTAWRASLEDLPSAALGRRRSFVSSRPPEHDAVDPVRDDETGGSTAVLSVHERDVDYGEILGTGGFCEVRLASLRKDRSKNRRQYAMKYLSLTKFEPKSDDKGKPVRNKKFERGIADLAIEAQFLTLLSHENIISLHYVSKGSLEEQFNCGEDSSSGYRHKFGFFLLLDPLYESLGRRIENTYVPAVFDRGVDGSDGNGSRIRSSSWWKRMTKNKNAQSQDPLLLSWKLQLAQRLEGLRGVASALQYLHDDCRVVYRDFKPDNVGFYRRPHSTCRCGSRSTSKRGRLAECLCYDEVPKLFDFGLAKELKPKYLKAHPAYDDGVVDTYRLTGKSGSRRYMSPEVAFSEPYNEKADVYSFGIVLYQVASLVTPFEGFSMNRHQEEVLAWGDRPSLKIPSAKTALAKARKGSMSTYDGWNAEADGRKRKKHMLMRTKCVWTPELRRLVDECWHGDLRERPGMKEVVRGLDECIRELRSVAGRPDAKVEISKLRSLGDTEWPSSDEGEG